MEVKRLLFEESVQENYGFEKKGTWQEKTVEYWLAEVVNDSVIKLQEAEVKYSKWMQAGQVHTRMTFPQAKELSKQVAAKLDLLKVD